MRLKAVGFGFIQKSPGVWEWIAVDRKGKTILTDTERGEIAKQLELLFDVMLNGAAPELPLENQPGGSR